MNAQSQTRGLLENALRLAWQAVSDETLINEFFFTEDNMPKGLILADKEQLWKNMIVKRFAIMNEMGERFKNA